MFTATNIILVILWFISGFFDYAYYLYLWQLKEYRVDKMRDFLRSRQGLDFILTYRVLPRAMLIIGVYVFLNQLVDIRYIVIGIFLLDVIYNIRLYTASKLRRPTITKKIVCIAILVFLIELFFTYKVHLLSVLLLFVTFRFAVVSGVVVGLYHPTQWVKKWFIKKATTKLKEHRDLVVIGITGSYGKTSVKTFLSQMLAEKYDVIYTPKNINTEIGIAKFIMKSSFKDKKIFVVEMGAYTMGEIKLICDMVNPQIGILTAINEQHLSLFGSLQNTQKAKYELLRAVPETGLAIANSDNALCREFLHELKSTVQTFGFEEIYNPTCLVKKVASKNGKLSMTYTIADETISATASILGDHNVMNIAPCVLVATHLNLTKEQIIQGIQKMYLPEKTLRMHMYGTCTIIDDTYNANPDGFKAALSILSSYSSSRKRVIITRGLMELAERSEEIHTRLGEEISFVADELIVITKDFDAAIRRGMHEKYKTTVHSIYDRGKLLAYVQQLKDTNAVILLENRIPSNVYQEITKPSNT